MIPDGHPEAGDPQGIFGNLIYRIGNSKKEKGK